MGILWTADIRIVGEWRTIQARQADACVRMKPCLGFRE